MLCSHKNKNNGKPILGDDEIPIAECLERVDDTERCALAILSTAPLTFKIKSVITAAIIVCASRARHCCRLGGVWKACLQPLLQRYLTLKDWDRECRKYGKWPAPDLD